MFYRIISSMDKKYCYAYKDISVIGINRYSCPVCARPVTSYHYSTTPHQFELEGGTQYPDLLEFCGAGTTDLIVSSRTLHIFRNHEISGILSARSVRVNQSIEKANDNNLVEYYIIKTSGRIDLSFSRMQLKKKRYCNCCGQFEWNKQKFHPIYLDPNTWDGNDLCLISSIPGYKICSEKVLNLVKQYGLTGFAFEDIKLYER